MLIACPQCATTYEIKSTSLGEGRTVRCARCQTTWFATAQEAVLETAGAAGPGTGAPDQTEAGNEGEFYAEATEPRAEDFPAETGPAPAEAEAAAAAFDAPAAETMEGAPPLVPGQERQEEHQEPQGQDGQPHEHRFAPGEGPFPITGGDVEAFRRRRASKRSKQATSFSFSLSSLSALKWPLAPMPTLLLGLGATVAILIGWRTDVVRLLPQTASFYSTIGLGVNLRGLAFENIKTSREINEGIPVIVVEGEIVSVSRKAVDVPRLRFGVRNGLGAEIYNWTAMPGRNVAQAGERVPFRARLASPPVEAHDVSVRFYTRRDAMAGLR
jgi:predicted Zn finger-like uncharacterized protein